ncbi:MAG: hypothetical protein CVT77_01850 [Alphaproteobacteria bacterium HGW-Alphaproteobacteria-16]|nr:MAG: hypothetical protein CVT77_01850 [Alphaproteobacteria bacterium HGW-Alphaproteobacteria-16]
MTEYEPELALPRPPGTQPSPPRHSIRIGGFTLAQFLLGLLGMAALIWAIWATHAILDRSNRQDIVSVRLSSIIGEYVQAQARSASPPALVEAEMRRFMESLDTQLQARSAKGQIVLVGEAVLSRNVPDVTAELRRSVYQSGIALPDRAPEPPATPVEQRAGAAAVVPSQAPETNLASPFDGFVGGGAEGAGDAGPAN